MFVSLPQTWALMQWMCRESSKSTCPPTFWSKDLTPREHLSVKIPRKRVSGLLQLTPLLPTRYAQVAILLREHLSMKVHRKRVISLLRLTPLLPTWYAKAAILLRCSNNESKRGMVLYVYSSEGRNKYKVTSGGGGGEKSGIRNIAKRRRDHPETQIKNVLYFLVLYLHFARDMICWQSFVEDLSSSICWDW